MGQLFMMECKKIVTSVIYWLFVAAIVFAFWFNYGNVDEEEIDDASSPFSVFYQAQDGQYAAEQNNLSEKSGQNQMMLAVTNKLLHSYRSNSYEYYPFGYIKEKVFSESEQNIVLKYLQEITGLNQTEILNGTKATVPEESEESKDTRESGDAKESKDVRETGDTQKSGDTKELKDSDEIGISGEGAYVAKPGAGSMKEAGKYEFRPDEWEYVENPSALTRDEETDSKAFKESKESKSSEDSLDSREDSWKKEGGGNFSIHVSFQRFMEIIDEISGMIGKDSYFSRSLIDLYYGENDMEDSAITFRQHEEFYKKDKITGAFARYYCDSIALEVLLLPAFVIAAIMAEDRRNMVMESIYTKPIPGFKFILIRYLAAIGMMLLPVLLLPLRSFVVLAGFANTAGYAIDLFAFPKYIFGWILPTLLFVAALSLFLTVLTRSSVSVLLVGVLWLFFKPSVGKIAGGNYALSDIVIRHNTLKGFGRMMQQFNMLVINRIFITGIAFLLVLLSVWVYQAKRRGGLSFHVWEFVHYRKREL